MIKFIIIFVLGFILGIAFSIEAISKNKEMEEAEKKKEAEKVITEKKTSKVEVTLPYLIPSFATEEDAALAAKRISEEYMSNDEFLSLAQYNDIFQFPQENPLHRMYGWRDLDHEIFIEVFEQNGIYKLKMPDIKPLA